MSSNQFINTGIIIAPATVPGHSAIAMIRLSGHGAIETTDFFFSGKTLANAESHTAHYGKIIDDKAKMIDEVLVTIFRAPKSYTGEDVVEITCHGSPVIVQKILDVSMQWGVRMAAPGEFTLRAFLNAKMDLSEAEAVADIIASNSGAAHTLALSQMRGGIKNEISALRSKLIDFASLLELELDFGEEDVEFADRTELKQLVSQILGVVNNLRDSFHYGNAIKHGVTTVIAGRPNAGKSTLLNALVNEERAIVSEIPGTTRDLIEEVIHIEGVAFRLIDTAGIRDAQNQIESIGIEKAKSKARESSILIYVFDVTELNKELVEKDIAELNRNNPDQNIIAVANKMDRNPYAKKEEWVGAILTVDQIVPMSAKNKMNVNFLRDKLSDTIRQGISPDQAIVSNARHVGILSKVRESLEAVQDGFENGVTSDFIAMDIRQAIHWLGEITGEVTTDDLLENIFSNFCIGK